MHFILGINLNPEVGDFNLHTHANKVVSHRRSVQSLKLRLTRRLQIMDFNIP